MIMIMIMIAPRSLQYKHFWFCRKPAVSDAPAYTQARVVFGGPVRLFGGTIS